MKTSSLLQSCAAAALLTAALFAVATVAQAPQAAPTPPPTAGSSTPEERADPAPTNLQVLPKNLTGQQVRAIMEEWTAALGAHCDACHAAYPDSDGRDGRPRLNFASDSKPVKAAARLMYAMTEAINVNYVSKIGSSGAPVTCGTCHRGHLGPEPFSAPANGQPHPRPAQMPGDTAPPSGKKSPQPE